MTALIGNPLLLTSAPAAADDAYQIEKSLRFGASGPNYLSKTFGEGDRRKWTWAGWVKRGTHDQYDYFFTARSANTNYFNITFTDQGIKWYNRPTSGTHRTSTTTALYRDSSAWYHIVFIWDTAQMIETDRARLYVNGKRITDDYMTSSTWPSHYEESVCNDNLHHEIGAYNSGDNYPFEGYIADPYFISGLAIDPSAWGSYDSTGVWTPKAFEMPTPNNGTTWSSNLTGDAIDSSYPITYAFDGTEGDSTFRTRSNSNDATIHWGGSSNLGIKYNTSIRVKHWHNGNIKVNDVEKVKTTAGSDPEWIYVVNGESGTLNKLSITSTGGQKLCLYAIEIDGVMMKDGGGDPSARNNLNDGTVWSSAGTWAYNNAVNSGNEAAKGFDGNLSTFTANQYSADGYLEYTFPRAVTVNKKLEVNLWMADTAETNMTQYYTVNSESEVTMSRSSPNGHANVWRTLKKADGSQWTGSLTKLKLRITRSDGNTNNNLYAIRIDDQILIDSTVDNSSHLKLNDASKKHYLGKDSLTGKIADATGGLPIYNTTDDYGEVKGAVSGEVYRDDSSAGTTDGTGLILAIPGDGAIADIHHSINTGSSVKSLTATSVTASDTSDSRFYGSSFKLDAQTDGIEVTSGNSDFAFGTGDFTIEMWVNQTGGFTLYDDRPTGTNGNYVMLGLSNTSFTFRQDDTDRITATIPGNNSGWKHLAAVRNSGTTKLYYNGAEVGSWSDSTNYISGGANRPRIGHNGYANPGNYATTGSYQDVRVYKGVAKYTSNFTVPNRNDWAVNNINHVTPPTPTVQYGEDTSEFAFDSSSTSLTKDTTGYSYSTKTSPYTDNLGSANAATVLKTADGTAVTWTVETSSSNRYLWTSSNGVNWSSTGSTYDTDGSVVQLSSAWLCWAGGSNADAAEISWAGTGGPFDIDTVVDSPTNYGEDSAPAVGGEVRGNYCTWNPLTNYSAATLSNGNLDVTASAEQFRAVTGTLFPTSGKWYFETTIKGRASDQVVGIAADTFIPSGADNRYVGRTNDSWGIYGDGRKIHNNTFTAYANTWAVGDVLGIAYDLDAGKMWFAINNSWQVSGNPSTGANETFSGITGAVGPAASPYGQSGNRGTFHLNTGQRAFKYSAPTGFKTLCTQNLTNTFDSESSENNPSHYFNTINYFGNGGNNTLKFNFRPDFAWISSRDATGGNNIIDAIRGDYYLMSHSNNQQAEFDGTPGVTWDADANKSITLNDTSDGDWGLNGSAGGTYAGSNGVYAGAFWDAGTAAATASTTGDINPSDSWVNATAGFEIIKNQGNATNDQTIGHNLGNPPEFIISKRLSGASEDWCVRHKSMGWDDTFMKLNTNDDKDTSRNVGTGSPTNTVFYVGSDGVNNDNSTYIHYLWTPIAGFSAFGSYAGTGTTDGKFCYCGFKPKFIITKVYDDGTNRWNIHDTVRNPHNPAKKIMWFDSTDAQASETNNAMDILSNGFKLRGDGAATNASGDSYIWAAWADNPFKISRAN